MTFRLIHQLLYCLGVVLFTLPLNAQNRFDLGEIYAFDGDTIQGYLKELKNEELSIFITFSEKENGDIPQKYLPGELLGFKLENGKIFHSKEVESLALSQNTTTSAATGRASRFLQLIRGGAIGLYRLHNVQGGALLLNRRGEREADVLYNVLVYPVPEEKQSNK